MASRKDDEEPLKAVVFADDCGAASHSFFPCTSRLLNLPILSWQLGVLARFGVKEAVVLSSNPIQSLWQDPLHRMKVTSLHSSSWTSEGDALRDLEARDGLRPVDDFVLVQQGAVFNVNAQQLVAQHKQRKEADRNWLVTTVFRKGAGSASTGLVIGVDKKTGTLLKYLNSVDETGVAIDVRAENAGLQNGGAIDICADVVDVGLDVCAPDFLLEFRENFYYDKVRAYIKEKLDGGEAEVFGNRMYAHFLNSREGQFGARIHSLASLSQATADILAGWMNPVTATMIAGKPVEISTPNYQSEYLLEKSLIGDGTTISVGSTIVESVIGSNVKIASDVIIRQSVLMDNTVVRDRCNIYKSVIDKDCVLEEGVQLRSNCYLDSSVRLGVDVDLEPNSLITLRDKQAFQRVIDDDNNRDQEDDDDMELNGETSSSLTNGAADIESQAHDSEWLEEEVGVGGKGRLINEDVARKIDAFFDWKEFQESFFFEDEEEDELEEDEEDDADIVQGHGNEANGLNGEVDVLAEGKGISSFEDDTVDDDDRVTSFNREVAETIERAFSENVNVENTTLEVNSLKLAYNCSFAETLTGLIAGLAVMAEKSTELEHLYGAVDSALDKYEPLANRFVKDDSAHHLQVAMGLAKALGTNGTLLMYVYKAMYEKDMLEEEGILGWASKERQRVQSGAGDESLLTTLSPLLDWLEDSDDEDE